MIDLSVVEQRYRAVLAVLAGAEVSEVAAGVGVSRQTLHTGVSVTKLSAGARDCVNPGQRAGLAGRNQHSA
ncbi:hypothetical protein ACFV1N_48925, partial [Streptosporangium canum]